jgi:hypothetical protein
MNEEARVHRCWWALVALAGVFAMHGLQCVSHDLHGQPGHGAATTLASLSLPAASGAAGPSRAPDGPAASAAPDHRGHAAIPPRAPGNPPSPLTADFWAVCLAVVAAVLVLLAAVLMRRWPAPRGPSPWAPMPRWARAPALPRPPDLFALCVLRN